MITLTIDQQKVTVPDGLTIHEVARQNGIHIPTLCHMDGIHDTVSCRICVVEIDGYRNLQPSCAIKAADGMVIQTNSDLVRSTRKTLVDLLLSGGEHNCISCESNGDCALQNVAYELGVESPSFVMGSHHKMPRDFSSEMIIRDDQKCILCGRCVTACNDQVVNNVLAFGNRGEHTTIMSDNHVLLGDSSCVQCGHCIQQCPVGALVHKKSVGKGRPWETHKVRTTCPYCGVGCQMDLHVKGEQIVKITGAPEAFPNKGRLCVKGRYGYDFVYSEDRLKTPLIKENGAFREASWEEALDLVASKFKGIIEKHGSEAVAGISSARSINEDSYYLQKLIRATFRSRNIDHCARG